MFLWNNWPGFIFFLPGEGGSGSADHLLRFCYTEAALQLFLVVGRHTQANQYSQGIVTL
jgi:hypothetical protein